MNDNRRLDDIVERGLRESRDDALAAAIVVCQTVVQINGSALDCVASLEGLRKGLNDAAAKAGRPR